MEMHPYHPHHPQEIEELRHHGLIAVRPHAESGQEIYPMLARHGAVLAEIREHGSLVGYVLDPRIPVPGLSWTHMQPLYELAGINLTTAQLHMSYPAYGSGEGQHGGQYYGGSHHQSSWGGHHGGGALHRLGDAVFGEHGEGHHGGGHHGEHH